MGVAVGAASGASSRNLSICKRKRESVMEFITTQNMFDEDFLLAAIKKREHTYLIRSAE